MLSPGFKNLSVDEFKQYIDTLQEKDYMLIDVRQPEEYTQAHMPGAKLIPLMELEAVGSAVSLKKIYNLMGGIMAWDGKTLADSPRVKLFSDIEAPAELLLKSMDLEKGALRFYAHVVARYTGQPLAHIITPLVNAERIHAQSIYRYWEKIADAPVPFDELFVNLEGDILEGGEDLESVIKRFETIEGDPCLRLIELALDIEYCAYDLYRIMADRTDDEVARSAFLTIAQVEKSHMQILANAVDRCAPASTA